MKIAIDVHALGSRGGGNETYYEQLVQGLARTAEPDEFTLLYTHDTALLGGGGDPRFRFERVAQNPYVRLLASIPIHLARLKPDLFHCQYVRPPFVRATTVVTIHDIAFEHYPEYFHPLEVVRLKMQVRATARRAARILTVSQAAARDISKTYELAPERIVVASPAPSERFRPRDKMCSQQAISHRYSIPSPFALYVGRIQARKNLSRLVEAYARVRRNFPELALVIVGGSDWKAERLFSTIREQGLESAVRLPGHVSGDDLPLFYNAADLFVYPSIFEGFGLPVIESMASGLPTITSRGSSLEEVAADAAVLVDPESVKSIAAAMERVLSDKELRQQMIERGLRRSRDFTVEGFVQKIVQVYHSFA